MNKKIYKLLVCLLCCFIISGGAGCGRKNESAETEKENNDKPSSSHTESGDDNSDIDDTVSDIIKDVISDSSENDFVFEIIDDDLEEETATVRKKYTVSSVPRVYLTTANTDIKFRRQDEKNVKVYGIEKLDRSTGTVMDIDPNKKYQTIEGFGASLTDTSSYNISLMPENMRNDLMTKLFDPEKGIGLSFLRQPIGVSDFNVEFYTYDDMPQGEEDWDLKNFSIERDKKYIIPLIKQAQKLNSNMRVISACWSPPLWMKTKYEWFSENRAMLRTECYEVFAKYLVKYIKAYEAEGIPIYSISPQNESTGVHGIPACYYDADMMAKLVNYYLRPMIDEAGIDTEIWIWDFNWFENDILDFIGKTFGNADAVATHYYSGSAEVLKTVNEMFPNLNIHITEAAGQKQGQNSQLFRQLKYFTESFRAGAKSWILWNICLDENLGPFDPQFYNGHGIGLTEYNRTTGKLAYQMDFYALAHMSKFIQPGASVIESNDLSITSEETYYNLAALNKNGTATVIIGNQGGEAETFKIVICDKVIEYTLPSNSVATITWDANTY